MGIPCARLCGAWAASASSRAKASTSGDTSAFPGPRTSTARHVSQRLEVPEGMGLVFLPPYFPELQPVERVWPLVDAGRVDTEGELWARVEALCAYLRTNLLVPPGPRRSLEPLRPAGMQGTVSP
ncbi:MAG: hypothetical protein ACP5P8_10245 [Thermus sp.]